MKPTIDITKLILGFLIAICITVNGFTQTDDPDQNHWLQIGLIFSPDYSYRTLRSDDSLQWIVDIRNELEIPKFGYTVGVSSLMQLSENFQLELGMLYSNKGEKTQKREAMFPGSPPNPTGTIQTTYTYSYIDIPLKINFIFFKSKIQLFASMGASFNFALNNQQKTILTDDPLNMPISPAVENQHTVGYSMLIGVGIEYALSNAFRIRAEPIFRHSLRPIVDAPIKHYLYSIGINLGAFYQI